ncbi:MAG: translation elongation factor Ts [Mycoplasmoidaceae bacterium]
MADAKLVKELRNITQAGFLDCQKALDSTNGNMEEAVKILKEKGIAKAEKKSNAVATEGVTDTLVDGNKALIIEVNSQTDFVAQNEIFLNLVNEMKKIILNKEITDVNLVENLVLSNGQTIKDASIEATSKIGEKISFRRANIIKKDADSTFGIYTHYNKKYSSIVVINKDVNDNIAKDVAMHVGAMNPKFLNKENVDQAWLQNEKELLIKKTIDEGKPKEFAEKIVEGRVGKLLAEYCLVDQPFVKEPNLTVGKYVSNSNNAEILSMIRYELGDGIVKEEVDFAAEVAAQMGK